MHHESSAAVFAITSPGFRVYNHLHDVEMRLSGAVAQQPTQGGMQ